VLIIHIHSNTPHHIMSTVTNTEVVFFALSQCNTGNEMLEYIDSLLDENSAD